MLKVHASVVAIEGKAVLLRGPSGSGKSDLALRLMDQGAKLVSDDYVELHTDNSHISATPPDTIRGLMEIRGVGLIKFPCLNKADLALALDLVPAAQIERLPVRQNRLYVDGVSVPLFKMDGLAASAPARIRILLENLDDLMIAEEIS